MSNLKTLKTKGLHLLSAALILGATSCVDSKDLYEGPSTDGNTIKDPSTLFDFSTSNGVALQINYGYTGYSIFFEIYTQNPLNEDGTRNDAEAIYKAYTDENSCFSGSIDLPAATKSVFVYSSYIGVPVCIEAAIENNTIMVDLRDNTTRSIGASGASINIGAHKQTIDAGKKLYALYDSYEFNKGMDKGWMGSNSIVTDLYSLVPKSTQLTPESTFGELLSRVNSTLKVTNNSKYIVDEKYVNVTIAEYSQAGDKIEGAHLDLVLLSTSGGYSNAMGYYYYKTPNAEKGIAQPTANEIKALPKYMVFPRTTNGLPKSAYKARLQFFGENYDQDGTDAFPAGYTIGWMLVPDIAGSESSINNNILKDNALLKEVNTAIAREYVRSGGIFNKYQKPIYSNQSANLNTQAGCIALNDMRSQKVIIGFEDQAYKTGCGDKSYQDVLFYVEADPFTAIFDPDKPFIPEEPGELEDETYVAASGTVAFEDIWPYGGDYDMNDVVLEYKTTVTINGNNIKSILDEFTCVHKPGSCKQQNAFGFVINDSFGGTINQELSTISATEEAGKQFILFEDATKVIGETFTVVREFSEGSYPNNLIYRRNYNPFLVPHYVAGKKERLEIHLPMSKPTSWASEETGGENAYYMNADGTYPFAIDLAGVTNFEQVTEMSTIGEKGEYPLFKQWTESKGENHKDWYTQKK